MKIVVFKSPKLFVPFLRKIFKISSDGVTITDFVTGKKIKKKHINY